MIAGKLDKYITIEQPTYSVNSTTKQKVVSTWTTYKNCFAKRVNRQGVEVVDEGQQVFRNTFEYTIRYYDAPAVKADMRINFDSDYYYIVGIKELGRKEGWMITAITKDND